MTIEASSLQRRLRTMNYPLFSIALRARSTPLLCKSASP